MTDDNIDCHEHRTLLEKLYLIAELKPGKTLSVKTLTLIDHTILTSWYRWWNDEDRFKSIDYIYSVFDITKKALHNTLDDSLRKSILLAVKNYKEGILTLLVTYKEDCKICSRVNTLLTEIHLLIEKYEDVFIPTWLKKSMDKSNGMKKVRSEPCLEID